MLKVAILKSLSGAYRIALSKVQYEDKSSFSELNEFCLLRSIQHHLYRIALCSNEVGTL